MRRLSLSLLAILLITACSQGPSFPVDQANEVLSELELPVLDAKASSCIEEKLPDLDWDLLFSSEPEFRDFLDSQDFATAYAACADFGALSSAMLPPTSETCTSLFTETVAASAVLSALLQDEFRLASSIGQIAACARDQELRSTPQGRLLVELVDMDLGYLLDDSGAACVIDRLGTTTDPASLMDETFSKTPIQPSVALVANSLAACAPESVLVELLAVSAGVVQSCAEEFIKDDSSIMPSLFEAYLLRDNSSGVALIDSVRTACPADSDGDAAPDGDPAPPEK